ncbi:MAG TPA: 4-alpha-glucanotransferase [Thermodesulfobacteriota bacterium]|nr:4-alpha-glucanotransferase [Thermodesulfobacteriota bacterium]
MKTRGSGVLLHVSSLPSAFGIGDLGPQAYRFADFLAQTKQSYWQILPLNPTDLVYQNSPYHSTSAFACNPLLISPELLHQAGLLSDADMKDGPKFPVGTVDYETVTDYKRTLLFRAVQAFKHHRSSTYELFLERNAVWLNDFAVFMALHSRFDGRSWNEWPVELRDRNPEALVVAAAELSDAIERIKIVQYLFSQQWYALKEYCFSKGIQIIGDLPIYVQFDSVDVWTHPSIFKLGEHKQPYVVAGVPPDYFSSTGQLWGNPVYNWDVLKDRHYDWWVDRLRHNLALFDIVRIDHFRGLVAYWEVPAHEATAIRGRWVEAPVKDFFKHLHRKFSSLPVIAEDLGVITPDVREVMSQYELPGMKVLLFAFGPDIGTNPYIPHNLVRDCIVYTGTHDNNTTRGWLNNEASAEEKARLSRYLGCPIDSRSGHWDLIRMAMRSVANTSIIPMQDLLGLGEEARMNRPAVNQGNWRWQLAPEQIDPSISDRLREMTEAYGRV